jgi:hypothetical protein
MRSLRYLLLTAVLALTGLAVGCGGKSQPMKDMTVETGRPRDTRPIRGSTHIIGKNQGQREPENGPAPPPARNPGPPAR